MKITVVVSAYDNWRTLDFTLLGFRVQTRPPDELIVAEDSEFPQVAEVVARHAALAKFPIRHLHHADQGFRKCLILNRAIAAAQGTVLVFTDADCIPRADLLAVYQRCMRPGRFVSAGSHVNLPQAFHETRLTPEMISSQRLFDSAFLADAGVATPGLRLLKPGPLPALLDTLTPRNAFVGNNSAAWRTDLMRVAGFDEAMGYGAEDSNLGIRLNHANVYGFRARHSLVCLHLDHPRSYRHEEQVRANQAWNRQLAKTQQTLPRQSVLLPT
jgi:glycosyltransferase involved in cell wall biosynthesis